jgi:methylated-DNA-[protein]-cysteine S-methyltransferase
MTRDVVHFQIHSAPRPVGDLLLAERAGRIVTVSFLRGPGGGKKATRSLLPPGVRAERRATPVLRRATRQFREYFAGERTRFDLPLALEGTPFQKRAWSVLRRIPYGRTLTYGEQAVRMGSPRAARAAGSANGKNPVAVVVPCHRVVAAGGSLGGFGAGLPVKAWLLRHEADNKARRR